MRQPQNLGWSDNVVERRKYPPGYTSVKYYPYKPRKPRRKKMPCRDDYPEPTREERRREIESELRHDSDLAEMLCSVLETIENGEEPAQIKHLSKKTQKWWDEHKERDRRKSEAERKAEQRKKATTAAYEKLTPEERMLLGVKKPTN